MAMIDDGTVVRNAEQLLTTEKGIAALTDEIAGCVVEAVVPDRCKAKNLLLKERRW